MVILGKCAYFGMCRISYLRYNLYRIDSSIRTGYLFFRKQKGCAYFWKCAYYEWGQYKLLKKFWFKVIQGNPWSESKIHHLSNFFISYNLALISLYINIVLNNGGIFAKSFEKVIKKCYGCQVFLESTFARRSSIFLIFC